MLSFISLMKYFHQINPDLYLNRDPILKKFCLALLPLTGPFSRKKAWCSMAHFHRCLAAFSLCRRKTKVCSCSWPWSSSSTTTSFSFFPWKSSLVIFGLQWTNIVFYFTFISGEMACDEYTFWNWTSILAKKFSKRYETRLH